MMAVTDLPTEEEMIEKIGDEAELDTGTQEPTTDSKNLTDAANQEMTESDLTTKEDIIEKLGDEAELDVDMKPTSNNKNLLSDANEVMTETNLTCKGEIIEKIEDEAEQDTSMKPTSDSNNLPNDANEVMTVTDLTTKEEMIEYVGDEAELDTDDRNISQDSSETIVEQVVIEAIVNDELVKEIKDKVIVVEREPEVFLDSDHQSKIEECSEIKKDTCVMGEDIIEEIATGEGQELFDQKACKEQSLEEHFEAIATENSKKEVLCENDQSTKEECSEINIETCKEVTDLTNKDDFVEDKDTEELEPEALLKTDQENVEKHSEHDVEASNEELSITDATSEQEIKDKKEPDQSVANQFDLNMTEEISVDSQKGEIINDEINAETCMKNMSMTEAVFEEELVDYAIAEGQGNESKTDHSKTEESSEINVNVDNFSLLEKEPEQNVANQFDINMTEEISVDSQKGEIINDKINAETCTKDMSMTEAVLEEELVDYAIAEGQGIESKTDHSKTEESSEINVNVDNFSLLEQTLQDKPTEPREEEREKAEEQQVHEQVEQNIDEICTEAPKQDIAELEDQAFPEMVTDESESQTGELETTEQQEIVLEEGTNGVNRLVIVSSTEVYESHTITQLDQTLNINDEPSEAKPSNAEILLVEKSREEEVAKGFEGLPVEHVSYSEDLSLSEVLVNIKPSSEIVMSTTEESKHEVHLGEVEVKVEGHLEEAIPCQLTEVALVEHAAVLEESTAMRQEVISTSPDLVLKHTFKDSEKIAEETFIPCVDNTEVLDEPKLEAQLPEVGEVSFQCEKEEHMVPQEITTVDVQHALLAQLSSCTIKDVASHLPDISAMTTTALYEPRLSTILSEQEKQEVIESTTPLEVNNVTQVAQDGTTVLLMHASSVEYEDIHQVQVQVVNVDIQPPEPIVAETLEIGVQEDKKVVDSCNEIVDRVDLFSAISNIEPEIASDKSEVEIQEVVQHVKDVACEPEKTQHAELPTDLVENKSSDDQRIIESQDDMTDIKYKTTQNYIMATEEEMPCKMGQESTTNQNQNTTPNNAAVAVPQNTGIISSIGNVEAPSSLSLEFKLNIQFGQTKMPSQPTHFATEQNIQTSSPLPAASTSPGDKNNTSKTIEMSEVGVQAVEEDTKCEKQTQKNKIVMTEAAVQATEKTEEVEFKETPKKEVNNIGCQLPPEDDDDDDDDDDDNNTTKLAELSEIGLQAEEVTNQEKETKQVDYVGDTAIQTSETNEEPEITEIPSTEAAVENKLVKTEEPTKELSTTEGTENQHSEDVSIQHADISVQDEKETDISVQDEKETEENEVMNNQSILIDVSTLSMQQGEMTEDLKMTTDISVLQIVETMQQNIEEKAVLQTELVVLQLSKDQSKQTDDDDENQDIWMDAEENIDEETIPMPVYEIERSFESEPEYFQDTTTDFEESIENIKKIGRKCDIDSEGEDFAVVLENPKIATAITTFEWD